MSTNKTLKRLALVAVASLGLSLVSVAPSNAANVAGTQASVATASAGTVLGTASTSVVSIAHGGLTASTNDTLKMNVSITVPSGSAVSATDSNGDGTADAIITSAGDAAAFSATAGALASGVFTTAAASSDIAAGTTAVGTLTVTPDVAGTYVVTVQALAANGTTVAGTAVTFTVYGGNLWGEVGDGVSNGTQQNLTLNGVAGVSNTVTLSFRTSASTSRLITVAGSTINSFTTGTNATAAISTDRASMVVTDDSTAEDVTFTVSTPAAGTITVRAFSQSQGGIYSTTAYGTVTITVNAATITGGVDAATSTSVLKAGSTWAAGSSATTDDTVVTSRTASTTPSAVVRVTLGQVSGAITGTTAVTASITGPGTIVLNDNNDTATSPIAAGRSLSSTVAATTETFHVLVQPDGNSGVATVTVTVSGYTATETITFHGAVASYVLTTKNAVLAVGSSADTEVFEVQALDAAGVAIPNANVFVSSGTTSIATVDSATVTTSATGAAADIGVNGIAKGSAVITVGNAATSPTVSATATIKVVAAGIASVALSFDKTEYTPGEKATLSITARNADGELVGDQEYANLFATGGITSSSSLTTDMSAVAATTVNGVKTFTVYMPLTSGPVTVNATLGTSVATAIQATVVSATTKVGASAAETAAAEAADAAAEAIDAANAATDAANLAAEAADAATVAAEEARDAADAATAAVEELATQVATLMAALKAQITTLANTVAKIAKRVRA